MIARLEATRPMGAGRAMHAVVMPVATFVLATTAHAQASPCDDYKAVLEARFEAAGVRGYSLELVPASAPVPPGAKVIANCEGGARKFVYRRWGGAGASPTVAASAVRAASATQASTDVPTRQAPPSTQEARALTPPPAAALAPVPPLAPKAREAKTMAATPVAAPAVPVPSRSSGAAAAPPIQSFTESTVVAAPAALATAPAQTAASAATTPTQHASTFAAAHWPWIGALVALLAGLWLWRTRFSAYDSDGLPRGPRL